MNSLFGKHQVSDQQNEQKSSYLLMINLEMSRLRVCLRTLHICGHLTSKHQVPGGGLHIHSWGVCVPQIMSASSV